MGAKSKVYFTTLKTSAENGLVDKMEKLCKSAGFDELQLADKLIAIKIHFGEPGNLAFLRHNYAARMAGMIRGLDGRPFLTDANTLYRGRRSDAVDHLLSASENGYTQLTCGCPVIIADGLRGYDHREIPVDGRHFRKAYIASAIAEADAVVSLNHFKGHVETGYGGAVKNIGMGSGSRVGKMEMHSSSAPRIAEENCVSCGACVSHCAYDAVTLNANRKAEIDPTRCVGCGQCVAVCNFYAARISWEHGGQQLGERVVEYAAAILKGKPHFHVNVITNVSPLCDCEDHNDIPLVPDIGILASCDPIAIDAASADLVTAAPAFPGSRLEEHLNGGDGRGTDKFSLLFPHARWRDILDYAAEMGLGNTEYELIHKEY